MGTSINPNDNSGTLVVTPQTGAAAKSATEIASSQAMQRLNETGTALPAGQEPAKPAVPVAPAAGQAGAAALPAAGGTETPKPGDKPAEGQVDAAAQAALDAIAASEAATLALTVELPITVMDGETEIPLTFTAADPETATALRELVEDAVGGRQSRALIDNATRQLAQFEERQDRAALDPVGFTINTIGDNIEGAESLAKFLLAQPSLFERLKPQLQKLLSDPNELRALAGDVASERSNAERTANEEIGRSRAVRSNLQDVQTTIAAMLPSELNEASSQMAFLDCLRDLKQYADDNRLLTLPVNQIPALLADRLTALGINPDEAASRAAVAWAKMGGASMTGRPALKKPSAAAPRTPPVQPVAKPNGQTFLTLSKKKAEAGGIPGAGAGSPGGGDAITVTPKNPDGSRMTSEQATAWHRARLAKGVKTY